ncbi:GNAT family N-acetyltransferase [Intestinimonas sp. HCP28S3_D6]|uniref:GNAT family N-acetyltransferase n=1 Tax=Intestinimonas sp. HCP28S3_D6 TaxID=3438942 RepID=UPI003F886B2E
MEFIYEAERIYVKDESGRMAAQVTFHQRSDRAVSIDHTYVSPELRGQGTAGKLMAAVAKRCRQRELKVVPVCSYAVVWFQDHPEESDLLK